MKKAALYVRVSTQEQKKHGLSVDSQIVALKEYCQKNNYQVVGIYNDAGISARKKYTKRPALLNLIKDCQDHKIDIILFTKLDRWFRSVGDYYEVQSHLDACKVPWRAIWEDYETETSSGIFKVNIMLSVAQSEADRTSERIKSTFEYKRAKGDYIGSAPYGYKRENNQLIKNPEEAPFIDAVIETYIRTHSTTACIRKAYDMGKSFSMSTIYHILTCETYSGNAYGYACEPYITPEQKIRIEEIRKSNYRSSKANHTYLFTGLCYCPQCKSNMRANAPMRQGKYYQNYFCPGTRNLVKHEFIGMSEIKIEKYLLSNLDTLLSQYELELSVRVKNTDRENIDKKKNALQLKLERIGVRYEEGDISTEEYKEKRRLILDEIASLKYPEERTCISLPSNWKDAYQDLDPEHRRDFWFSIIKRIEILPGSNPKITFL